VCDQQMIDARAIGGAGRVGRRDALAGAREHQWPASPRVLPAELRKPRTIVRNSGSSSRKASWPLSVTISANDTRAELALSACTIARESEVGNSQSLVNEITQKRVGVPLKALASTPSQSAARSK